MPMPDTRLSQDDWVDAAVQVLLHEGPDGVAVQPLARRLKTTKGSFYWHFSSREELLLLADAAHPDIGAAIERVTDRRIEYIARLLRGAGLTPAAAQRRATLAYATYLG